MGEALGVGDQAGDACNGGHACPGRIHLMSFASGSLITRDGDEPSRELRQP